MLRFILVAVLLVPQFAHAKCDTQLLIEISNKIGYKINEIDINNDVDLPHQHEGDGSGKGKVNEMIYACKSIPNINNLMVFAFATYNKKITLADPVYGKNLRDGGGRFDLNVLVVNKNNGGIEAKFTSEGVLESNAVALQRLSIDTARYYLESGSLIFGVRVRRESNSHSYISNNTDLYLFKFSKNKIYQIIDGLKVDTDSCSADDNGEQTQCEQTQSVIIVGQEKTNGMNDIEVLSKYFKDKTPAADCAGCNPVETKKILLKYDGQVYPIPKAGRD